jgi:hypothetical protein
LGRRGFGDVLVGEVSSVNDDEHDNHFLHPVDRYNNIWKTNRRCWCCVTNTTCSELRRMMPLISLADGLCARP